MVYLTSRYTGVPGHRFCPRCDRAYRLDAAEQVPNWAWHCVDGEWHSTHSYDGSDRLTLAKLADQAHTEINRLQSAEAAA